MIPQIDDYTGKRVHMIGIGGSSMSGLAGLLARRGCLVTGSDNYASYLLEAVRASGVPVTVGHRAENVRGADLIVFSAAIAPDNAERAEAKRLGIPEIERSTLLGQLMRGHRQAVGVSGTHGKTTCSAMLAQALVEAGLDPSVHIGGSFDFIGGGTRAGAPDVFVAEACEFHNSFLEMRPTVAVVLNVEADHLDFFGDIAHIIEAFRRFIRLVPPDGVAIVHGDDARARAAAEGAVCRVETFGVGAENDWRPVGLQYNETGCASFSAVFQGKPVADVSLKVAGDFNAMNALAALAAAHAAGADTRKAAAALGAFRGVHRRFEHTGDVDGVLLYHDYGHNPTEMRGALSVAKKQPHNRLWAVMQPHTYSRVKTLFADYIHCCDDADEILVTDIYAAREADPGDIHSTMIVDAIAKTGKSVHYTPTFDDAEAYLRAHWQPGDLVLTMGCGNVNELNDQIQKNGSGRKRP